LHQKSIRESREKFGKPRRKLGRILGASPAHAIKRKKKSLNLRVLEGFTGPTFDAGEEKAGKLTGKLETGKKKLGGGRVCAEKRKKTKKRLPQRGGFSGTKEKKVWMKKNVGEKEPRFRRRKTWKVQGSKEKNANGRRKTGGKKKGRTNSGTGDRKKKNWKERQIGNDNV